MKGAAMPSDFQVKCANCGAFFRLNRVHTYDNGYYCHTCYLELQRQQRLQSKKEVTCAVCGRVLALHDSKVQEGGKGYCPVCYNKSFGGGGHGDGAAGEAEGLECADCGKALAPDGPRVQYYDRSFCVACYDRAFPNLPLKMGGPQIGDELASLRTGSRVTCTKCSRDLGPLDVKVHEGGAIYCDRCDAKVRKAPGRGISEATRQSAFVPRHSATALRDQYKLIECAHCGRVYTSDGLAADERGRYLCPVCGKDLSVRPPAVEEKKPEKRPPVKMEKEDFAVTAQLFKCLADPCRVKIIESLSEKELNVFAFVEITGAQYSLTSYHLKVLKELGLIKSYKRGNFVVYSLTEKGQAVHEFISKSKGLS